MDEIYVKEEKTEKSGRSLAVLSLAAVLMAGFFFLHTQFPDFFKTRINVEKTEEIDPKQPIVINFSKSVILNYFNFFASIQPETDFDFQWENYNRKLTITPKKYWLPENKYKVSFSGRNYFLFPFEENFHFKTIDYPKISDTYPDQGQKDVSLDIEDPIKFKFDSSIENFKVKFIISPFQEIDYKIDEEKKEIHLMPKKELLKGEKYSIETYIKHKNEEERNYRKIGENFFETKPPVLTVWDKDFSVRLEQARKFTEAKIKEGKYIDINLKSQIMTIFENGKVLDAYLVSTGKRGMETSQGNFKVHNKVPRAWSKKYGLFMPYWMAMVGSGEFGIHELPEWPGGYKEGTNHLGIPVSHGCIRLGVGAAERVYSWAEVGTPVIIHS